MDDVQRTELLAALEAATGPSMRHDFKMWMCGVVACRVCGIVKRRDGNNKPCRGPVEVAIRARGEG